MSKIKDPKKLQMKIEYMDDGEHIIEIRPASKTADRIMEIKSNPKQELIKITEATDVFNS